MKFLKILKRRKSNTKITYQRFARWRVFNAAIFLVLIVVAAYFFFRSDVFIVRKLSVDFREPSLFISNDRVTNYISRYLSKSIFFIDTTKTGKEILATFLEIKEVDIKKVLPDQIIVNVVPRQPVILIVNKNDNYVVDDTGFVFAKTQDVPALSIPQLSTAADEASSNDNITLGKNIDVQRVADILSIVKYDWTKIGKPLNRITMWPSYYELTLDDTTVLLSTAYTINEQTNKILQISADAVERGIKVKLFDLRFERPVVRYF